MGRQDRKKDNNNEGLSIAEQFKLKQEQLKEKLNINVDFDEIEKGQKVGNKKSTNKMEINHIPNIKGLYRKATAPYNFVPLNEKVIEYKSDITEQNDKFYNSHNTGYIEIEIETVTPIYTRDTFTLEEIEMKNNTESNKKTFINSSFYSPTEKLALPGSTLRGMIRTLVEILSFSKFGFYKDKNDKYFYFRGLADESNLRKAYQDKMSLYDRNSKKSTYKMSSGVLVRENLKYFIIPASSFQQIKKESNSQKNIVGSKEKIKKSGKEYKLFNYYLIDNNYIVVSGDMDNKKNDWLIKLPLNEKDKFQILEEDIKNYLNDPNRSGNTPNLIKEVDELYYNNNLTFQDKYIPCFYSKWTDSENKNRVSFGHTAMFRLSYDLSVGDHIPGDHKDKSVIDITESFFGVENKFATRVFFEDCILSDNQNNVLMEEKIIKILSNPKPTTFQHYLVQTNDELTKLNHYNTPDISIRGNKLYHHKSDNNWQEDKISTSQDNFNDFIKEYKLNSNDLKTIRSSTGNIEIETKNLSNRVSKCLIESIGKYETQHTKIQAVKPNIKFTGRIRFENLSNIELGSLLQSLKLPQGCLHKIGMGKPYGLGSIKITPKLYLSNRENRYKSLFSEWESINEEKDINKYINNFQEFIIKELNEKNSYWNIPRLRELKFMLDYERGLRSQIDTIDLDVGTKNRSKTIRKNKNSYMSITPDNEFKKRPVLPLPSDI